MNRELKWTENTVKYAAVQITIQMSGFLVKFI